MQGASDDDEDDEGEDHTWKIALMTSNRNTKAFLFILLIPDQLSTSTFSLIFFFLKEHEGFIQSLPGTSPCREHDIEVMNTVMHELPHQKIKNMHI